MLGADLLAGHRRRQEADRVHPLSSRECAHGIVSVGMWRVRWGQNGTRVLSCGLRLACSLLPTPQKTKVGVVRRLQFLDPLTQLLDSWLEWPSKAPIYINRPQFTLHQLLFVHQHVFPSIVLHVLNRRPEAISASLSFAGFDHHTASVLH